MSGVLAIIPARGGTKLYPRLNTRPFLGKPLVAHAILRAWEATAVDRVVVWTDDAEIARAADEYGAEVKWRPAEHGDPSEVAESLVPLMDQITTPEPSRLMVLLRVNTPLRRCGVVQAAIETLERERADSLFTATPLEGAVWRRRDGRLDPFTRDPSELSTAGPAEGEYLVENGSIHVFRPWVLREHGKPLGGRIAVHPMDPLDALQINEPSDFERLERLSRAQGPRSIPHGLERIRLLVLDFDGVMTDNRVWVHQDGTESVACHRGDGLGIGRLRKRGLEILVISTETNPVVAARCRKLGLESIQGCDDKLTALQRVALDRDLEPGRIAYVGNDLNDLECLGWVGTPIAVADALPEVLKVARLITQNRGGHGAVREVTDWLHAAYDVESPQLIPRSTEPD